MFTQVEPGTAVSSDGFKVIDRGRKTVYVENDHMAEFVADPGGEMWVILLKHVAWNPPYENEPIHATKREQIRQRVVQALKFLNPYCVFDFDH